MRKKKGKSYAWIEQQKMHDDTLTSWKEVDDFFEDFNLEPKGLHSQDCNFCAKNPPKQQLKKIIKSLLAQERRLTIKRVWRLIDGYARLVITYKDGSKTKAVLEHSLKQAREISLQAKERKELEEK